jgi:hypothetical protein
MTDLVSSMSDGLNAFLDTSVILSREFGPRQKKKEIKSTLKGKRKTASTYSITEVNRTFLKDAIFLYSILTEEPSLHTVFERLQKFPMTERRIKRCLALLDKITDNRQIRIKTAMAKLENLIFGTKALLFRDVATVTSGTLCPLSQENVEFDYPAFKLNTSCTKSTATCSLAKYLKANTPKLLELKQAISSDPKMEKLCLVLEKAILDPNEAKGRRCQTLGDLIICLDAPYSSNVYSTNVKDFAVICHIVKKKFVKM